MFNSSTVRRTAGLGIALVAALGLSACGGGPDSTPTETVTVTRAPDDTAANPAAPAASGPATPATAQPASPAQSPSGAPSPSGTPSSAGASGAAADSGDPFGGMGTVSGPISAPAVCDQIGAFRANLPSNVENDPEGARDAVANLRSAAPQELRGNLQGLENILNGYVRGEKPMQAIEGKTRGLINQCQNLAKG